jgi:hypothetical protein
MDAKRKPNWSKEENLLLVQSVLKWKDVIRGKFSPTLTSKEKKNAWQQIVLTVNAAFPRTRRSAEDCEKRWYNVLATTRKEIAAYKESMRATGTFYFSLLNHFI